MVKTSAGPMANDALARLRSSLSGGTRPASTSGSIWAASTAATARGTNASGIAKSMGTKASWLATVKPDGVSNSTRIATHITATDRTAATGFHPCGDGSTNITPTAATNPRLTTTSTKSSPRGLAVVARRRVSASSSCSSSVGSLIIVAESSGSYLCARIGRMPEDP